MRKYFLLSAVAILAATNVNATTDYAEVTAKATIEVAGTFECSDLDFGTIVVKQGNAESIVTAFMSYDENEDFIQASSKSGDIISVSGASTASCGYIDDYHTPSGVDIPTSVTLIGNNGSMTAALKMSDESWFYIDGTLTIPANVKAGEYTGSFTVTATY
ncbi:MAG: DUF4402 domain-containing protein [Alphaproteobacteria bacterium]|nr:DUF4402 domain-containing protein [Alphaproteobacteria bacterium]